MQASLLDITLVAQLILFFGYLLYGIMRTYPSKEDRAMILFYVSLVIGFVTAILVLNSILSLPRYLPGDIPILISLLALDIILFLVILIDTFRQRESQKKPEENREI
jgi:uncharacterized protein YhhL (DUF1145 family)